LKKINKHNYELFFLDFIEGNLSESQIKDLNEFLAKNPNLKIQFDDFENVTLKPELIKYEQKEELIKQTQSKLFDITHFEYLAIAELENDISIKEKKELKNITNKKSELEIQLYKNTKLKADENIVYPFKNKLKRKVIPIYVKISSYAAASIIALFLILNQFNLKEGNRTHANQLATIKKSDISIVKNIKNTKLISSNIIKQDKKQEFTNSHNQTNKLTTHKILAFDDNEPQNDVNLYKTLNVLIPDLKTEALIFKTNNNEIENTYNNIAFAQPKSIEKDKLWQYAETGVKVWKLITFNQ